MIGTQSSPGPSRKADLQIHKELLAVLGLPPRAATIARRLMPDGGALVVRLAAPGLLSANQRLAWFKGFPVTYEVVRPLKIGRRWPEIEYHVTCVCGAPDAQRIL
jgi:hypothetical protein